MADLRLIIVCLLIPAFISGQALAASDDFMIEVEGMPKIEGGALVKVGFGNNMKYSFGTTEARVSIAMPGERLSIKFQEAGLTCQNFGDTSIEFGETKAEITGKVGCLAQGAKMDERQDLNIQGWFNLD